MNEHRNIQLQRLVDAELDRCQIQQLVTEAESRPDTWREMALAFVEDQVWRREIKTLDRQQEVGGDSDDSKNLGHPDTEGEADAGPLGRGVMSKWLALAASVLVLMSISYWAGGFISWSDGTNSIGQPSSNSMTSSLPVVGRLPDSPLEAASQSPYLNSPYKLQLVSDEGQPIVEGEIPLIPYSMARETGYRMPASELPADVVRELRQAGYDLRPDVRFLTGRTSDGLEFAVPVHKIRLVTFGQ